MKRLRNLSLGTKFTIGMVVVFAVGIGASWLILSHVLEQRAEVYVSDKGMAMLETINAVRQYTSAHVKPLVDGMTAGTQSAFVPETVPAFSSRQVFENLRANEAFSHFLYKEATDNPTNPNNMADDFERSLLASFRGSGQTTEISGFRSLNDETVFYAARPMLVASESCMQCHSTPDVAPASLINTYGSTNGFGWHMGQVIAAQVIYVPADEVLSSAQQSLILVMIAVGIVFAVLVLVVNALLRRTVLSPIKAMAALAEKVSADDVTDVDIHVPAVERVSHRGDELGKLTQVFQRMATNVVRREQKLKERVRSLQIEIDQTKEQEQIAEIVNTEYFHDLQAKAAQKRRERSNIPQ